jgi:hypothetical protein
MFMVVTVYFENNRVPIYMILDVIEVAVLHLGVNLTIAFADILVEFRVSNKVH